MVTPPKFRAKNPFALQGPLNPTFPILPGQTYIPFRALSYKSSCFKASLPFHISSKFGHSNSMVIWPRPLQLRVPADTFYSTVLLSLNTTLPVLWRLHSCSLLISQWLLNPAYSIVSSLTLPMTDLTIRNLSMWNLETRGGGGGVKNVRNKHTYESSTRFTLLLLIKPWICLVLQNMSFYPGTLSCLPSLKHVSSNKTFQFIAFTSLFNQMHVCMV